MLSFYRTIGLLTPIFAIACAVALLVTLWSADGEEQLTLIVLTALGALAGGTLVAFFGWVLITWRLDRFSRALERTITSRDPTKLRVRGVPAERRLARAFNAAARALAQVEAKSKIDALTGVANREVVLTRRAQEVERANRYLEPLSAAFIDIDRFK
ncbi:MAG TPA: diguanylate cyclase, partial [Actinomycetota bacterium]|nr:diguanylate cyclase [Actinomycetota bacterium]